MAQFRARIITARSEVARLGHKTTGLTVEANGWDSGIRVYASHEDGKDVFLVYLTGGSHDNAERVVLAEVTGGVVKTLSEATS